MMGATQVSQGMVAILDALGAANYFEGQIAQFINARAELLKSLQRKAEGAIIEGHKGELEGARLSTFTFGDTILVAYATEGYLSASLITRFFALIRQFLVESLVKRILFRGAIGVGDFLVDNDSNTVLGGAVADAAGWYEKADWLGVLATPRASLMIDKLLGRGLERKQLALVEYDVPIKGGTTQRLKCVNWPKVFLVPHLLPAVDVSDPRAAFLDCLAQQSVPVGTESKYFNSLKFFDYSVGLNVGPSRRGNPRKRSGGKTGARSRARD